MKKAFLSESGGNKTELADAVFYHLRYSLGRERQSQSPRDMALAVSLAVRDRLVDGLLATEKRYQQKDVKRLYYLSMEYLIGRSLGNNLYNLNLIGICEATLQQLVFDLEEMRDYEYDAALGNGGLGCLAACFLDSLASLDMPGFGYGINYEYGLFKQEIDNGYQREKPDNWLAERSPWQIERAEEIETMRHENSCHPRRYYLNSPAIRRVMDALRNDRFSHKEPGSYRWLFDKLVEQEDEYFHLADMLSYLSAQEKAAQEYRDRRVWVEKAILNVARMGKFSSDRTIRDYAEEIWKLKSAVR